MAASIRGNLRAIYNVYGNIGALVILPLEDGQLLGGG
jgi:hypothetical protein